jgi:5-hydroxyisourate hydrolase
LTAGGIARIFPESVFRFRRTKLTVGAVTLSTHVLDAALGRPAAEVRIVVTARTGAGGWEQLAAGVTDPDGRLRATTADGQDLQLTEGVHRIDFDTGAYFTASRQRGFYPQVSITFEVHDPGAHYHVPLLLSPFAYSTYRGS